LLSQQVAAAQVVQLRNRVQPALGILGQATRVEEVSPRLCLPTAYASTQLVELREAQPVSPFDNERVRTADVQTALNDGRGEQQIVRTSFKVQHYFVY